MTLGRLAVTVAALGLCGAALLVQHCTPIRGDAPALYRVASTMDEVDAVRVQRACDDTKRERLAKSIGQCEAVRVDWPGGGLCAPEAIRRMRHELHQPCKQMHKLCAVG